MNRQPLRSPSTDEIDRLQALRELDILDSEPEESYDRITRLAARALQVPVVLVSLVDEERQWFKSKFGFAASETPRAASFCSHAVADDAPLMVPDARNDPRFADNPLVTGEPHIRAYFGIPLRTKRGFTVGTLCAIDGRVRSLTAEQEEALTSFAAIVEEYLHARELARATRAVLQLARDRDRMFSDTFEQAGVGMAHLSVDGTLLRVNSRLCELVGYSRHELQDLTLDDLTGPLDPNDGNEALRRVCAGQLKSHLQEVRCRRKDRRHVWVELSLAASRNHLGGEPYLIAAFADISARKVAEDDLMQVRDMLQSQVAEQTAQLRESNQALLQQVARAREKEREARYAVNELKHLHYALDQHAPVSVTNLDGIITYVNQKFCDVSGYTPEELIGEPHSIVDSELFDAACFQDLWKTILAGSPWHGELCKKKKSGDLYWVEESIVPYKEDSGKVAKFVSIRMDITQRKLHEQLLAGEELKSRRINQRLRQITDSMPALISYWDRNGICRFANQAHFDRFGLSSTEIVGMSYAQVLGATLDDTKLANMRAALMGERRTFDHMDEDADGTVRYWQSDYVPEHQDGDVTGFFALVVNITERKNTEQRLVRQESILSATGRMGEIGGWELERDSIHPIWSEMLYKIHELPAGQPVDLNGMFAFFPPEARLMLIKAVQDGFCEAKPFDVVAPFVTATGRHRWIRSMGEPQVTDGIVTRITGAFQDITHQKQFETDVAHAQKLESIGQLSAGIAHEINTPTQFIGNNVGFIKESLAELVALVARVSEVVAANGDPVAAIESLSQALRAADLEYLLAEVPKAIEQSVEGIERIKRIVGAMKDFSHPGVDKALIDINRAIQSTVIVASNEWKYVAEVDIRLAEDLPPVAVIPGSFNQVILNIIVNAAHAVADAVEGKAEKGTITVCTRQIDTWVEVSIADTGCGIPKNIRDRIFDPFFTTKAVGKGTGQGLAIAHDVIVKKHSGTIAVESEIGLGTTFILRLPIDSKSQQAVNDV